MYLTRNVLSKCVCNFSVHPPWCWRSLDGGGRAPSGPAVFFFGPGATRTRPDASVRKKILFYCPPKTHRDTYYAGITGAGVETRFGDSPSTFLVFPRADDEHCHRKRLSVGFISYIYFFLLFISRRRALNYLLTFEVVLRKMRFWLIVGGVGRTEREGEHSGAFNANLVMGMRRDRRNNSTGGRRWPYYFFVFSRF